MGFSLALYPIAYRARFDGNAWREEFIEQPHLTPAEEAALSAEDLGDLNERRNHFAGVPLVNFTTQYGMGCFEGLKAFPQKGAGLRNFQARRERRALCEVDEGPFDAELPRGIFRSCLHRSDVAQRGPRL